MKRNLIFTLVLTISISLSVMFFPCQSEARDVTRVSVDSAGGEADDRSRYSSIRHHLQASNLAVLQTSRGPDPSCPMAFDCAQTQPLEAQKSWNHQAFQGRLSHDPSYPCCAQELSCHTMDKRPL